MKTKLFFAFLFFASFPLLAQFPSIEEFTKNMSKQDGFLPLYWNDDKGKLYMEIGQFGKELLYYPSLAYGVGSNDIGLDRGKLSDEHIVKFERFGNKILMIEPNYKFRAITSDPLEKKAVEESFAQSVQFGFEIVAKSGERFVVELTPFVLQDAIGAIQEIEETKQGNYKFDLSRSAVFMPMTKSFPKNTEIQTIITLTSNKSGNYLNQVVPSPEIVTMHQHHSFVELPEPGFKMRTFDPRIGYGGIEFYDFASPISEPIVKKYISRHRLEKKDPTSMLSEPIEPIVYYMDPGTPEPIRSALMEGASWWNKAFEAAGYLNAFQVKLLPPDADPMDIRYNLIQWVHRSTRGWSYGASVIDPRSGEILKGKVTLGSLRVRQDYLIAQGLVGNFVTDTTNTAEMRQLALLRLKQLAAHEVGHTLGLPHNYIASIFGRASVMDYPHPLVTLSNGKISLDHAYTNEIGEYDKSSIFWGYQDIPKGVNEKQELERIVQNMFNKKLKFLTDQDARPDGSLHPQTHLWDNGADPVAELKRVSEIRSEVLKNFDEKKIRNLEPMATLEEVLVPMYMFHRYQLQAVSKIIGGADYSNSLRGDGQLIFEPTSAKWQNEALNAMIETLSPNFLALPQPLLKLIPPRPFRYMPNYREVFKRKTGMSFDPIAPAEASASLTLSLLLNVERANRLVLQKVYQSDLPNLKTVLSKISADKIQQERVYQSQTYFGQIDRMVANLYIAQLMRLSQDKNASSETKMVVLSEINKISNWIKARNVAQTPMGQFVVSQIALFNENPSEYAPADFIIAPDGQPIESGYEWLMEDCFFGN